MVLRAHRLDTRGQVNVEYLLTLLIRASKGGPEVVSKGVVLLEELHPAHDRLP